jgi:hypothetical protein
MGFTKAHGSICAQGIRNHAAETFFSGFAKLSQGGRSLQIRWSIKSELGRLRSLPILRATAGWGS